MRSRLPFSLFPLLALAAPATAQDPPLLIERGGVDLLRLNADAGLVVRGSAFVGEIPATGAGLRLMWHPAKGAFRAGQAQSTQWDDANIGLYSMALGYATTASGTASTALGHGTVASGSASAALGRNTTASGANSTALGLSSTASGVSSTAMGWEAIASGTVSTAIGRNSQATAIVATAIGDRARATGAGAVALGVSTHAEGGSSTAFGDNAWARGQYSTAGGKASIASGEASVAMGFENSATGFAAVALGYRAVALADHTVALGHRAFARDAGSFVFGDASSPTPAVSSGPNSFTVRAQYVWLGMTPFVPAPIPGRYVNTSTGAYLSIGGVWTNASDVALKEGFREEDPEATLQRLAKLPVRSWSYRAEGEGVRHVGPTAQDFRAAFGLGHSDVAIGTVDITGVSLLAVQALERRTTALHEAQEQLRVGAEDAASASERIARLEAENAAVRAELEALLGKEQEIEALLRRLERTLEARR